jgi:hypothetical protein
MTEQPPAQPRRGSVTLVVAGTNLAVSCVATVALLTAGGSHLSTDVHDGGVIFMVWTAVISPTLSVITAGLALGELQARGPHRARCWVGMGITACLFILSGVVWASFLNH